MKQIIYKYPLEINDLAEIRLPINSQVVDFKLQGETPTVWILQDLDEKVKETRNFLVVGTGWDLPNYTFKPYGTIKDGSLIWHLLEVTCFAPIADTR